MRRSRRRGRSPSSALNSASAAGSTCRPLGVGRARRVADFRAPCLSAPSFPASRFRARPGTYEHSLPKRPRSGESGVDSGCRRCSWVPGLAGARPE